jgi:hypothetical protein
MPVELHATSPDQVASVADFLPDRRWRYGVEKDSFATLIGHWRTGHNWRPREVGVICEDFTKKNTEAYQVKSLHSARLESDLERSYLCEPNFRFGRKQK